MTTPFDPDFDNVYRLTPEGHIAEARDLYAPDVSHSETEDITIDGDWSALTGHTGQYAYSGAVMHPSEQWGDWAITALTEIAQQTGQPLAFSVVEVRDTDGCYPDGDPIGWAVTYRAA